MFRLRLCGVKLYFGATLATFLSLSRLAVDLDQIMGHFLG